MADINLTRKVQHPLYGNHLTSTKSVSPGTTLISSAHPLLIIVENASLSTICSYCFLSRTLSPETTPLKRCAGCKLPHYCSLSCQKADWSSSHSKVCGILKRVLQCPPTPVRALMELLLKVKSGGVELKLESHMSEFRKGERWSEFMMQARAALEFAKIEMGMMEIAVELLCCMATNSFRVTLPDDTPVGLCFEPTLALANHSCSPNATIIFNGRTITLRALTEIKAGEQIFISYVDPIQPRDVRRQELKDRYFFTCQCTLCHLNETPYQTTLRLSNASTSSTKREDLSLLWWNEDYISKATQLQERHAKFKLPNTQVEAAQLFINRTRKTQKLEFLHAGLQILRPQISHRLYAVPPLPALLNELYLHHLSENRYIETLIILLFTSLQLDPYTYPQQDHPIRISRLYTLATLFKHISSLPTASLFPSTSCKLTSDQQHLIRNIDFISANQVFLIFAHEAGKQSHGEESVFVKEVEEALADVEEVQKLRGDGMVGRELRRWMIQSDVAVEGKLLVETLCGALRDMVGMIGSVINGFEI